MNFLEKLRTLFSKKSEEKSDPVDLDEELVLVAPMSGRVLELSQVPDPSFAQKIVGDGVAILPVQPQVVSPVAGVVTKIFHTKHACLIQSDCKRIEILIHIGIDTVQLKGEGFKLLVEEGAHVEKAQPLLEIDLSLIQARGLSLISPIIIATKEEQPKPTILAEANGEVQAGQSPIMKI